jgi:hypothetical protein
MSHFRMLLASVLAALAFAVVGPLFMGVVPAFADGPNMGHPGMHDRDDHRSDRDDHRFDRDDHRPFFPGYRFAPQFQYVQPVVSYVQPVVYPVYAQSYAPAYAAPSYFWNSYGPGWNYGMGGYAVQQVCIQYNHAMAVNQVGAYNQFVQPICISIASGTSYTISVQGYP